MSTEVPLSIQLPTDNAQVAIPQIAAESWVRFRLTSLKQVNTEKGDQLKWEFDLVDPAPMEGGGTIEPGKLGSKQVVSIPLYAKEGAKNPTWYVEKVSRYMDALLGTGDKNNKKGKPNRPQFGPDVVAAMTGGILLGKMQKRKGDDGVERIEIGEVAFPADKGA